MEQSCDQSVTGYIYFIADLDCARVVKIGWSQDWSRRLNVLQSGYPFELTPLLVIPGTMHEEAGVLTWLAPHKTKAGRGEWFHAVPEVMDFITWTAGRPITAARGLWRFGHLLGRPNQLDEAVRLAAARTVTR